MATFTKQLLSGSTNGKQILVAATASPGTTIHTAVAGTSALDEIWIYAYNHSTAPVVLTLQWGGTTVPDNELKCTIPAQAGRIELIDGMLLQNGLIVTAFADTTNVILIDGFVNNIA